MAGKLKILVVDHEQDILVRNQGRAGEEAAMPYSELPESDTALEIFQRETPQICILDVHMPDSRLDGLGILKEIRKTDNINLLYNAFPVDDQALIDEAEANQANRHVMKPLSLPELETYRRSGGQGKWLIPSPRPKPRPMPKSCLRR